MSRTALTVTLERAFELAQQRARQKRCRDCAHALVGKGERCRCEQGHWQDMSLRDVAELRADCDEHEEADE